MIKWLYSIVWKRWLWNDYFKDYDRVIKVKGWRTAIIEDKAKHRATNSPCF